MDIRKEELEPILTSRGIKHRKVKEGIIQITKMTDEMKENWQEDNNELLKNEFISSFYEYQLKEFIEKEEIFEEFKKEYEEAWEQFKEEKFKTEMDCRKIEQQNNKL